MNPTRTMANACAATAERGFALLAVLVALTLLLLLALPFAVSMSRGASVAQRAIEAQQAELLSASVRDQLLAEVALGHASYDVTPGSDDRSEFPASVPELFPQLQQDGRARFGGETFDLQRKIALDAITPLLLSNLLGTTARLQKELLVADTAIALDNADHLPDSGLVWVDHEIIRYGQKQDDTLVQLERGLFADQGFVLPKDHDVTASALVLDWRCVLAVAWPFEGRSLGTRLVREPYATVGELAEIERAGSGGFTPRELDRLQQALGEATDLPQAPQWGRPERVFRAVQPLERRLVVKSALHLGAGSTVRLRNLQTGYTEYGLIMSTGTPPGFQDLLLPSTFTLDLLHCVQQPFPAIDTVVEPLVPAPVNVNTADAFVLTALFTGCRRGLDVRIHDSSGQRRIAPPLPFSKQEAQSIADEIVALRQDEPFLGFQEFAERLWRPRLQQAAQEQKLRLLYLYRLLLTGRDSVLEMGTAPIAFCSGPLVGYRAAAAVQRSSVSGGIAARHERTGIAVAQPGYRLRAPWQTQEQHEEAFRFDQRAPFWLTAPINTGAPGSGEPGNDPIGRSLAHVVGMAFPDAGLGEPRFPSRDEAATAIQPAPVSVAAHTWVDGSERRGHEAFATGQDPRGHDLGRFGPFVVRNTGPRDAGPAAAPPRTHELTFPFTVAESKGGAGRLALSAWFEPDPLAAGPLFDYAAADVDHNRIALLVRDGKLVFEVLDEAGLDPDPSSSLAGVERTACQWSLPLAELALPPKTPVHLSASAWAGRPGDLSVFVDGMARGKVRYRTRLSASIPTFDPSAALPLPPNQNNPRNLLVQVEDTEGFPPQGVLRIGTELFEYTAINGNSFLCAWLDSNGGRAARQVPAEHRPNIPVDGNGEPTVDIDELNAQGVNLDVFPSHPVGAGVELYGYAVEPQIERLVYPGETALDQGIGGFAVARGWLPNGRPITISVGPFTFTLGTGLDPTWTGDLELADPVTTGRQPARPAREAIANAFPQRGGLALLVQQRVPFDYNPPGQVGGSAQIGGIEVIRYTSRQGSKLLGVQRNQRLPGDDQQIDPDYYDGTARSFIADWDDRMVDPNTRVAYDDAPLMLLNVVPISLSVQSSGQLPDPAITGTSEWVQLYPRGADVNDTEWVRYDALVENRLVRAHRPSWRNVHLALTNQTAVVPVTLGPLGPQNGNVSTGTPWGTPTPTSGYIGYVPQLEADFPQIGPARAGLRFRGDPFTNTSSHPHNGSAVLPCHRMELDWGNFGALTGRPGRNDRVTLIAGSQASGSQRPPQEWHTVNWQTRRFRGDLSAGQTQAPTELLGAQPFQLVAFQQPVRIVCTGRKPQQANAATVDMRTLDRLVKFPSGELPAAAVEGVPFGGAADGSQRQAGIVDEIAIAEHFAFDTVVDEAFADSAQQFAIGPGYVTARGLEFGGQDFSAQLPPGGGLVLIDDEVIAYTARNAGTVQVAKNGRGLLNTEPRGHDRGARVHFLTHRPAGILAGAVTPRADTLPLQAMGALPRTFGTVLLARSELLHYCWVRTAGDQAILEMPRAFPPEGEGDGMGARGLLRGRYASPPVPATAGEPVILMPFRYWDRFVPRNDDPEQSYFQFTLREAPCHFCTLLWEEEVQDSNVGVVCLVRADERTAWSDAPGKTPFFRRLLRAGAGAEPLVLDVQATELEVRFAVEYRQGCLDLQTFRAHGWKTAPKVRHIELQYEGEPRILREQVTAR